jgi:hypothetical protein
LKPDYYRQAARHSCSLRSADQRDLDKRCLG